VTGALVVLACAAACSLPVLLAGGAALGLGAFLSGGSGVALAVVAVAALIAGSAWRRRRSRAPHHQPAGACGGGCDC
jgi:membrane protein implicated in regulation of membrane protease activity